MTRGVAPTKSTAPCWWCSKQLAYFHGYKVKIDGNDAVIHKACRKQMEADDVWKRRIERLDE